MKKTKPYIEKVKKILICLEVYFKLPNFAVDKFIIFE